MSPRTTFESALDASELRTHRDRYDRACKRLLSEKEVLGWLLHECLDEFKDVSPAEIASTYIEGNPLVGSVPVHADDAASQIVGMNSEDSSIDEGTVWYDIRFSASVPGGSEHIGLIINVEAQGRFYPGYPLMKRAAYYCGRLISSQYGRVFTKSHYEKLQKVCSFWICPNPPIEFRNTINRYAIAETCLVGDAHLDQGEYDFVEVVLACPDGDQQKQGDGILRLLGTLIASEKSADERKAILSEEFGIEISKRLSDEVVEMSDLSVGLEKRWYEEGVSIGLERGRRKGLEQGLKEGLEQGLKEGLEQGLKDGRDLGIKEGQDAMRTSLAQLSKHLHEQGRDDEFASALLEGGDALERLFEEFGIDF